MKIEIGIWCVAIGFLSIGLSGCMWDFPSSHSKVAERLGENIFLEIQHPTQITYFTVENEKIEKPLSPSLRWLLQETLLDDESYILGRTKQCRFIPELGFHLTGREDVVIYLSFSCRQVKVVTKEKNLILDIDPKIEEIEANFKDLMHS